MMLSSREPRHKVVELTAPLTSAEIEVHPEYPHVTWDLKPKQKGFAPVAKARGGPFNIAYEVHGNGPIHMVFIMGLGSFKSSWQRQTKDFAHDQSEKYSCLIIDNRGIGDSDKPFGRYSTSELAMDVVEVVDYVGWTEPRSLHVLGISMGGMIAQEMGLLIPARICTLTLLSTAARLVNTVGYMENLRNRINLFLPKSIDTQLAQAKRNMFSEAWLAAPDQEKPFVQNFPTNGDRFAASEVWKRKQPDKFSKKGFVSQAIAAGWHHKSPEQLRELGDKVGRRRILVIHGTLDRMITVPHSETLVRELNEGAPAGESVRKEIFNGQGHVIPIEKRPEFRALIEEFVADAMKLS